MGKILQEGLMTQIEIVTSDAKTGLLLAAFCTIGFALLTILIPYLLGSINSAIIVSKVLYRDDIRRYGSGNAGMTNMLRTFGKKAAVLTLLGDVLKTVLSILIGGLFMGLAYAKSYSLGMGGYLAAMFCVLGHVFPVYYRFKGGKGVLCAATAIAMLSPVTFGIVLVVFAIIVGFTKYVSLGSIMCALMYPLFLFKSMQVATGGSTPPAHMTLASFLIAAFVIWCHRTNLSRLLKGKENKISFSKKDKFAAEGKQEDEGK